MADDVGLEFIIEIREVGLGVTYKEMVVEHTRADEITKRATVEREKMPLDSFRDRPYLGGWR